MFGAGRRGGGEQQETSRKDGLIDGWMDAQMFVTCCGSGRVGQKYLFKY